MTDTLIFTAMLIPCLIVAIVFHEVAHGLVANYLGDPTARDQHRLSLNPLRHVDLVGTLLVPGFLAISGGPVFGWAKPVPVRQDRLDNPRYGMMAVAAAGPATNFILAAFGAIALGLFFPAGGGLILHDMGLPVIAEPDGIMNIPSTMMLLFIFINVFLGIFNLLPIPPFDGSHIVEGMLPRSMVGYYRKLRPYGMLLFIGLVVLTWFAPGLGVLQNTVGPPVEWAVGKYIALASAVAG